MGMHRRQLPGSEFQRCIQNCILGISTAHTVEMLSNILAVFAHYSGTILLLMKDVSWQGYSAQPLISAHYKTGKHGRRRNVLQWSKGIPHRK